MFADFTFAKYPASMLAAGSVCAAANGVLDFQRCSQLRLLQRLQLITHVDAVSRHASLNVAKLSSASYGNVFRLRLAGIHVFVYM